MGPVKAVKPRIRMTTPLERQIWRGIGTWVVVLGPGDGRAWGGESWREAWSNFIRTA